MWKSKSGRDSCTYGEVVSHAGLRLFNDMSALGSHTPPVSRYCWKWGEGRRWGLVGGSGSPWVCTSLGAIC